jgi:hypothetical protein
MSIPARITGARDRTSGIIATAGESRLGSQKSLRVIPNLTLVTDQKFAWPYRWRGDSRTRTAKYGTRRRLSRED